MMGAVLDVIGLALSSVYILLFVTAFWVSRSAKSTLRDLTLAIQIQYGALVIAGINAIVNAADVSSDGPIWPIIWVVSFGISLIILSIMKRRREIRGDQIMKEARRMLAEHS